MMPRRFSKETPMLSLTRKTGEQIQIHSDITITVVHIANGRVSIGIDAPRHIRVTRGELAGQMPEHPAVPAATSASASDQRRAGRRLAGQRPVDKCPADQRPAGTRPLDKRLFDQHPVGRQPGRNRVTAAAEKSRQ
jgi:carbon storage regulator